MEVISKMSFAQKVQATKSIADDIIADSDRKFKRINDLLLMTQDPKDVDIVSHSILQLKRVFMEIIPSYRIREGANKTVVDDEEGAKKGMKLSKEVTQLRNYEEGMLRSY